MNVTIRQLTSVTAEVVTAVNRLLPQLSQRALPADAGRLEKLIAHEDVFVLLAFADQAIAGMIQIASYPRAEGPAVWVDTLVVDEAYRGHGIAALLLNETLEIAKTQGWSEVKLTSRPERLAANKLYEKTGFERHHTNLWRYIFID